MRGRGRGRPPRPRRDPGPPPEARPAELVETLVRWLLPGVEAVRVDEHRDGGAIKLEVHVEGAPVGALIGRRGQTAQAIRALLGAAGAKNRTRYLLEIKG